MVIATWGGKKERWVVPVSGKKEEELKNLDVEEPLLGITVRAGGPRDSEQSRVSDVLFQRCNHSRR